MINQTLEQYISALHNDAQNIPDDRKIILAGFADFIRASIDERGSVSLNFICSHNSRRSHLAQVWAQVSAHALGLDQIYCYSGGTDATAIYKSTVEAIAHAGLEVSEIREGPNPIFSAKYANEVPPILLFSKAYSHSFNPKKDFGAIMTCGEADTNCPYIPDALKRIPVTYVDPKASDGQSHEAEYYQETCYRIAREMFYTMSLV